MPAFLQQNPIIVDVGSQKAPTGDITLDFVVGMFAFAGVLLLVATAGCLIVAAAVIIYKRRHPPLDAEGGSTSHTRLRI